MDTPGRRVNGSESRVSVYINLSKVQPRDSDSLFYVLISTLRESIIKWQRAPWEGLRKTYHRFLSEIVDADANLGFLKLKLESGTFSTVRPGTF